MPGACLEQCLGAMPGAMHATYLRYAGLEQPKGVAFNRDHGGVATPVLGPAQPDSDVGRESLASHFGFLPEPSSLVGLPQHAGVIARLVAQAGVGGGKGGRGEGRGGGGGEGELETLSL